MTPGRLPCSRGPLRRSIVTRVPKQRATQCVWPWWRVSQTTNPHCFAHAAGGGGGRLRGQGAEGGVPQQSPAVGNAVAGQCLAGTNGGGERGVAPPPFQRMPAQGVKQLGCRLAALWCRDARGFLALLVSWRSAEVQGYWTSRSFFVLLGIRDSPVGDQQAHSSA